MKLRVMLTLISFLCLIAGGCSRKTGSVFISESLQQDDFHQSPRYLDAMVPLSADSHLYELTNEQFDGKPYNNIHSFGDNLLLVGEAFYGEDSGFDYDGELPYEFSFDVYSPWADRILYSLPHNKIRCDLYQVFGDRLFLYDYSRRELSVYDSSLTPVRTYDISAFCDNCSLPLHGTRDASVYYTYNCDNLALVKLTFQEDSILTEQLSSNQLFISGIESSSGTGRLVRLGLDPLTLGYTTQLLDAGSLEVLSSFPGCGIFYGDMTENAFAAQTDSYRNFWVYQYADNAPSYFYMADIAGLTLLADGSLVVRQEHYEDSLSSSPLTFTRYDSTGKCLSRFTYECGDPASEDFRYLASEYACLPEQNCCFILSYASNLTPRLLVWDLNAPVTGQESLRFFSSEEELAQAYLSMDLVHSEEYAPVTLIPAPKDYDWGTLADVNAKATRLEETYDITIYLGPEIPEQIDCFYTAQENDPSVLSEALDRLSSILACYPENFFSQLYFGDNRGLRIYLTGAITGDTEGMLSDPSGFTNEINSHMVMVLDTNYSWDWNYTVNHEFSHMIDRRLNFYAIYDHTAVFSEETWSSFNPDSCSYLETYADYEANPDYETYSDYFVDSYGVTFATEDRAELFGWALSDYLNDVSANPIFAEGTPTTEKYRYYCESIRDGFDTSQWTEALPWEQVLQ